MAEPQNADDDWPFSETAGTQSSDGTSTPEDARGMTRAPLALLYLNVLIIATCGLVYELLAGTLAVAAGVMPTMSLPLSSPGLLSGALAAAPNPDAVPEAAPTAATQDPGPVAAAPVPDPRPDTVASVHQPDVSPPLATNVPVLPETATDTPVLPETAPDTQVLPTQAPEPAESPDARFQSAWTPFRSETSARGFARRLSTQIGSDLRVIKTAPGRYEVGFDYISEAERLRMLASIENL